MYTEKLKSVERGIILKNNSDIKVINKKIFNNNSTVRYYFSLPLIIIKPFIYLFNIYRR